MKVLDKFAMQYENYDADDPLHQKQLDEWKVINMPVLQIINESNSVLFQFPPGQPGINTIKLKMQSLLL